MDPATRRERDLVLLGSTGRSAPRPPTSCGRNPGPVPADRARRGRRQPGPAGQPGGRVRRRGRGGGQRPDAPSPAAAGRRWPALAGGRRRAASCPKVLAGPAAVAEVAAVAVRRGAERGDRRGRAGRDARRPRRRPGAGAGQQGVADHGRPRWSPAGRRPARSSRWTPSTRRSPSACAAAGPTRCASWW